MTKKMSLSATMEDYLEAIWLVKKKRGVVRVRDIAKARGVALPSVDNALKNLSQSHLVKHDRYEFVELTPQGNEAAKQIHDRHLVLSKFLQEVLGVDKKTAEEDACKMEHALSPESLKRLIKFMEFLRTSPSEMRFGTKEIVSLKPRKRQTRKKTKKENE